MTKIKSFNWDPSAALRAGSEAPHYPNVSVASGVVAEVICQWRGLAVDGGKW
jgi:hypothetical protein